MFIFGTLFPCLIPVPCSTLSKMTTTAKKLQQVLRTTTGTSLALTITEHTLYQTAALKSHQAIQNGHLRTVASLAKSFFIIVHMHTNPLATKELLFSIVELEIQLCA